MRLKQIKSEAFTLIEIIVSVTILSIILMSVFTIYIASTDINLKTDITRVLQQNIKSSIEKIAEDIRKNGFDCVRNNYLDSCDSPSLNQTDTGSILKIGGNEYSLAKKGLLNYEQVDKTQCNEINEKCTLVQNLKPIINSWVDVKDITFLISDTEVKKVTILMTLQPAIWKWIKPNHIKNNRFYFQTTISERPNLN